MPPRPLRILPPAPEGCVLGEELCMSPDSKATLRRDDDGMLFIDNPVSPRFFLHIDREEVEELTSFVQSCDVCIAEKTRVCRIGQLFDDILRELS